MLRKCEGQSAPRHLPAYNPVAPVTAPAGTFLPGTKVQVGSHRVVVEKYLSEGGFAHVYVVRLPQPINGTPTAVLKRVAVPDKSALASMRTEVETMKKLKGHRHIVKYFDSHASQLNGGGYENRLTEPEVIKIFSDVAEGVACMHYLKPPLLHRDLKVENVLISRSGGSSVYKLCDFGSTAPPRPAATSAAEGRLIEDDVQRHTTLQYRSPEMIDVYRKQPIDEKSDIWALGVLLYKLCYYTTPFEEVGQMAILNASFKFPSYPQFSDRLKKLIASMLKENPQKRPNIYEVVQEVCKMQGKEVPIRDIYSNRSVSEARKFQELPPTPTEAPKAGATFSPPMQETAIIPEIAPMRRGRPGKSQSSTHSSARPSPPPYRGDTKSSASDPFAALDGDSRSKTAEELSQRFPSLDQFNILHEKGDKFDFEPAQEAKSEDEDLSQRLTNALADDAFRQASPERRGVRQSQTSPVRPQTPRETSIKPTAPLYQPTPKRPTMISTGTMTSPAQTPRLQEPKISSRPIYRFPPSDEQRPSSQRWAEDERNKEPSPPSSGLRTEVSTRISSDRFSNQSSSARTSMETLRRPSGLESEPMGRSKSAIPKARPVSVHAGPRYDLSHNEHSRSSLDLSVQYEDGAPLRTVRTEVEREDQQSKISELDYLRAKEEEESNRKREKRSSTGAKHSKRSSLSSLSFSGGRNLLAGRFGEAFRRFESSNPDKPSTSSAEDPPQLQKALVSDSEAYEEANASPTQFVYADLDDVARDDIPPEMRRELERRRLSQEEKRVATAAAEYRRRVAEKEGGRAGPDRSRAIQNRVQTLLGESNKPPHPPKTASGYGKYTDTSALPAKQNDVQAPTPEKLPISRTPGPIYGTREGNAVLLDRLEGASAPAALPQPTVSSSAGYMTTTSRPAGRPTAPPKPKNLRVGTGDTSRPGTGHEPSSSTQATPSGEDWEANFSRRFPSLSGLEMETEIEIPKYAKLRTREV
ncbi:uncharacterized protein N7477_003765 [Penicillium maclennaniae]|uniref:uncharacterized protein n=1 Tax=Penicillium maclennaniae TaxID=1343394 RepID=UPI002541991E|nr:uncharacterized protein N7477_003765 [Penicillium maclennaniae]KAJ5678132.1 hypothetical protein N7477_003765 [Penicillium maclennaniae]